jgi:hypothetical protein
MCRVRQDHRELELRLGASISVHRLSSYGIRQPPQTPLGTPTRSQNRFADQDAHECRTHRWGFLESWKGYRASISAQWSVISPGLDRGVIPERFRQRRCHVSNCRRDGLKIHSLRFDFGRLISSDSSHFCWKSFWDSRRVCQSRAILISESRRNASGMTTTDLGVFNNAPGGRGEQLICQHTTHTAAQVDSNNSI